LNLEFSLPILLQQRDVFLVTVKLSSCNQEKEMTMGQSLILSAIMECTGPMQQAVDTSGRSLGQQL